MQRVLALLFLLAGTPIGARTSGVPLEPSQAVALADNIKGSQAGRFEMIVAAKGAEGGTVFLNSNSDYRTPDDLTFRLKPNVVKALKHRLGGSLVDGRLIGKRVIVDGTIRRQAIVNVHPSSRPSGGLQAESFNRWQHTVPILFMHQIVSID